MQQAAFLTRQFNPDDLGDVININRRSLPENYPSSWFLYIYSTTPKAFRVAEINRKVIGYCMGRVEGGMSNFSRFKRAKKAHIISVAILPAFRRQGAGMIILQESLEAMHREGASECYLEVRASNIPAVALYLKDNFVVAKTLRKYYRDGEDALLMGKKFGSTWP